MTLVEFLLARIAEDEADAQHAVEQEGAEWEWDGSPIGSVGANGWSMACDLYSDVGAHVARWDPARALAECAAKRRIVRLHDYDFDLPVGAEYSSEEYTVCRTDREEWPCLTLRLAALPYATHPDYRSEWAPDAW